MSSSSSTSSFRSSSSVFSSLLPKNDPARTISSAALLVVGTAAAYHFTRAIYRRAQTFLNNRAQQQRRDAHKTGVVYFYMFPKKPQTKAEKTSNKTVTVGALAPEDDAVDHEQNSNNTDDENSGGDNNNSNKASSVNRLSKMFSLSAPCMAVELFLRVNKIPFEQVVVMNAADVSPTQRLPCIEYNGKVITDSWFIMEFLEKEFLLTTTKEKNESTLREEQEATPDSSSTAADSKPASLSTTAVTSSSSCSSAAAADTNTTTDEHSTRSCVIRISARRILESLRLGYGRAVLVNNTDIMISTVAREFNYPKTLISFIFKSHRKEVIKMLNDHSFGDLTEDQFKQIMLEDVKVLESFVTKKKKKATPPESPQAKKKEEVTSSSNDGENKNNNQIASNSESQQQQQKECSQHCSQFLLGGKVPTKIDCLLAAQIKLMKWFDESIILASSSSSSSSKQKKKSSSITSSSTSSASSAPVKLISDSNPAFDYLMKSEIFSEYLRRIDKALSNSAK